MDSSHRISAIWKSILPCARIYTMAASYLPLEAISACRFKFHFKRVPSWPVDNKLALFQVMALVSNRCQTITNKRSALCSDLVMLTHWGRDKMADISHTTLSFAFSWMKMLVFRLNFHWSLFLRVQLPIFQHWFRLWLGAGQATSHYLNEWWLVKWRIYASLGPNELTQKALS